MAHGAEDQSNLLRMVRYMAGFFHDLDQQHGVALAVERLQEARSNDN
jgi:hypothetical protein